MTAKSLSEYARDLVMSAPPGEAHAALKELCVQRTLGGLPPWTAMAAELRRTAKAAGLDPAAEEAEVLADLLDAPATMRAAPGFWTGYRAALLRAAKADPAFRGKLLGLHPTPPDGRDAFTDWWIELLEESGAAQGLNRPVVGAGGRPAPARGSRRGSSRRRGRRRRAGTGGPLSSR